VYAHHKFSRALSKASQTPWAGKVYLGLCLAQFHNVFWISRLIPNTLALVPVTLALARYIETYSLDRMFVVKSFRGTTIQYAVPESTWIPILRLLGFTTLVVRSEVALLCFGIAGWEMGIQRRFPLNGTMIRHVLRISLFSVIISILLDSLLWQRWGIWPELSVFTFNTVENQSVHWGVSPWYDYWLLHVPKLFQASLLYSVISLIPISWILNIIARLGILRTRTVRNEYNKKILSDPFFLFLPMASKGLFILATMYISLYSIIPHKETRFIFHTIPCFNGLAALGIIKMLKIFSAECTNKIEQAIKWIPKLLLLFTFGTSLLSMGIMIAASTWNYPGGTMMHCLLNSGELPYWMQPRPSECAFAKDLQNRFHSSLHDRALHLDVYTAQTGASRYLQRDDVLVSKDEHLTLQQRQTKFTSRLISYPDWVEEYKNITIRREEWTLQGCVPCFQGFHLPWSNYKIPPDWSVLYGILRIRPCVCLVTK
jgi:alpha-1,6-mannosyltransferase